MLRADRARPSGSLERRVFVVSFALAGLVAVEWTLSVAFVLMVEREQASVGAGVGLLVTALGLAVGAAYLAARGLVRYVLAPARVTWQAVEANAASLRVDGAPLAGADVEVQPALRALIRALQQERARQDGKVAFVAALVHDLKARLSGLRLLLAPEEAAGVRGEIDEELRQVQAWLSRALDALRLDGVDEFLHLESCPIEDVCSDAARAVRLEAPPHVSVSVQGSALAHVDIAEFRRAMTNLLANAVRVARRHVSVEVYQGLVRIADDGPGLPAPLGALSEPFQRVATAGTLTTTGTGLGLFIARRVLELHGGRLVCERSDDRGTVLLAYFRA